MLELYLGSAFLAVHFDLLAQLLLVLMLDNGMLSVWDSFLVVWWPGESVARIGLTGLRSFTPHFVSFPSAGLQYGLNSRSFGTECNKVRKACRTSLIQMTLETFCNSGWIIIYCDLAEVRVTVAASVQQHLSLPLQESQWLFPGRHRPCARPRALMTLPQ